MRKPKDRFRLSAALQYSYELAEGLPALRRVTLTEDQISEFAVRTWFDGYKAGILAAKAKKTASSKRNERVRQAEGWHSEAEFLLIVWLFQNRCAYCWVQADLTEDHVIPLAHKGTQWIENILPACQHCNSKKGARV